MNDSITMGLLVNSLHLAACLFYPFGSLFGRKGCLKQIGDEVVNTTAPKQRQEGPLYASTLSPRKIFRKIVNKTWLTPSDAHRFISSTFPPEIESSITKAQYNRVSVCAVILNWRLRMSTGGKSPGDLWRHVPLFRRRKLRARMHLTPVFPGKTNVLNMIVCMCM